MHFKPYARIGAASLLLAILLSLALGGCVGYPVGSVGFSSGYGSPRYSSAYGSGYGYGYAGLNPPGNYHYYPRYQTYYSPQSHQYYCYTGSAWQVRSSPYGVSSRTLFDSPHVPLNLRGSPPEHHARVAQSYPSNWSPPRRNDDPRIESRRHSSGFRNR